MKTVTISAAKANFSTLLNEAAAGEEIVITKSRKPVARLTPFEPGRTWGRETGVVHLSGLQTHMCEEQSGAIRNPAHYRRRPKAEETASNQAGNPPQDA
jgi:prevent-host-death family protein